MRVCEMRIKKGVVTYNVIAKRKFRDCYFYARENYIWKASVHINHCIFLRLQRYY